MIGRSICWPYRADGLLVAASLNGTSRVSAFLCRQSKKNTVLFYGVTSIYLLSVDVI